MVYADTTGMDDGSLIRTPEEVVSSRIRRAKLLLVLALVDSVAVFGPNIALSLFARSVPDASGLEFIALLWVVPQLVCGAALLILGVLLAWSVIRLLAAKRDARSAAGRSVIALSTVVVLAIFMVVGGWAVTWRSASSEYKTDPAKQAEALNLLKRVPTAPDIQYAQIPGFPSGPLSSCTEGSFCLEPSTEVNYDLKTADRPLACERAVQQAMLLGSRNEFHTNGLAGPTIGLDDLYRRCLEGPGFTAFAFWFSSPALQSSWSSAGVKVELQGAQRAGTAEPYYLAVVTVFYEE